MNLSVNQDISSIDAMYNAQAALVCGGVAQDYRARRQRLKALLKALYRHREELLDALQEDLGKPKLETEVVEFHPTIAELKFALRTPYKVNFLQRQSSSLIFSNNHLIALHVVL